MDVEETIPFVALLLAAGSSTRLAAEVPKPYLEVRGKTLLEWSATRLHHVPGHGGTVIAADAQSLEERLPQLDLSHAGVEATVRGGASRQESMQRAFAAATRLVSEGGCVLVHDCARPFFDIPATVEAIAAAKAHGGAILGHYARDTLKRVADNRIVETVPRESVFQAATPQVFRSDVFARMLEIAEHEGVSYTDDAALAEAAGIAVVAVPCPSTNLKVTYPEDLTLLPCLAHLLEAGR